MTNNSFFNNFAIDSRNSLTHLKNEISEMDDEHINSFKVHYILMIICFQTTHLYTNLIHFMLGLSCQSL